MKPDVDVIIVAHNSGPLLAEAVTSAAAEAGEDRVWVVDAESGDGSVVDVAGRFPRTHILTVPNEGFSAGNNRGIEATSAPYVLLLNPDAALGPGAIDTLAAAMDAEPNAGIIGPLVHTPDGAVQAGSFGRFPSLRVRLGQAFRRLGLRLTGRPDIPGTPTGRTSVDWVTGAAMLVRRAAIRDAGPMDEAFFLYYEDIEWCHRMWDSGWRVVIEPAASVIHHLGQSGGPVAGAAYRASFERYCDLYGLWGLRLAGRLGAAFRGAGER